MNWFSSARCWTFRSSAACFCAPLSFGLAMGMKLSAAPPTGQNLVGDAVLGEPEMPLRLLEG